MRMVRCWLSRRRDRLVLPLTLPLFLVPLYYIPCYLPIPTGGGRSKWGHPTPRQRAAPSALLLCGAGGRSWRGRGPRQRAAPSALLLFQSTRDGLPALPGERLGWFPAFCFGVE